MKSPPVQQHLLTVRQQTENPRHDQNVESNEFDECNNFKLLVVSSESQGGRCWQPFGEGKHGHKIFVRRIFPIFATNLTFLRIIANFQISFSMIFNAKHGIVHFLPKKHCF